MMCSNTNSYIALFAEYGKCNVMAFYLALKHLSVSRAERKPFRFEYSQGFGISEKERYNLRYDRAPSNLSVPHLYIVKWRRLNGQKSTKTLLYPSYMFHHRLCPPSHFPTLGSYPTAW